MQIIHHIGASASGREVKVLKKIGIKIPEFKPDAITDVFYFDLNANSEQYKLLQPYISEFKLLDMIVTEFTGDEKDSADILVIQAQWLNGYPQPENNFREFVYNYPADAPNNGFIGIVQKDSFRLKKEPNWGTKKIFHLNWIGDEIFVRKDIYDEIFKRYNIAGRSVILYRNSTVIEDTVQLVIPETTIPLKLNNFKYTMMPNGSKQYVPYYDGFFPNFESSVNLHIWKSHEWFGSGQQSFKRIFITQQLRQEFLKYKLKVDYIPVK